MVQRYIDWSNIYITLMKIFNENTELAFLDISWSVSVSVSMKNSLKTQNFACKIFLPILFPVWKKSIRKY